MKEELLKINNGTLTIRNHKLADNINLQVFKSEVHGIILDDTEIKSAFIKVLCGEEHLSYGYIYFQEELLKENDISRELKKNVIMIDQTRRLISALKIYENMFFPKFHAFYLNSLHYSKMAQQLLDYFGIFIPVNKPIKELSKYECVAIELITAYALEFKLVILSNIGSFLNRSEVNDIFTLVSQLTKEGISFLVMENIEDIRLKFIDRVTLIKGSRTIGVFDSNVTSKAKLYEIFYSNPDYPYIPSPYKAHLGQMNNKIILSFDQVGHTILNHVSFQICKGEIIRFLYTDEASANQLISILRGDIVQKSGSIYLDDRPYKPSPLYTNVKNEICFIEENPIDKMLFKNLSAYENLCYPLCNKINGFWMNRRFKKSVELMLNEIIDSNILKQPVKDLSLAVLQKIIYCKWLLYKPKLLVCIKPFSIADAQNKIAEKMITLLAESGISILIITSSWPSLSKIRGKILYLKNGVLSEF